MKKCLLIFILFSVIFSAAAMADTATVQLKTGWNMFSTPVNRNIAASEIAANCSIESYIWQYNSSTSSYSKVSTIIPTLGYWVKLKSPCTLTLSGNALSSFNLPMLTGWNQIGSLTSPTDANSINGSCSITSGPKTYNSTTSDYNYSNVLQPGLSYWVRVASDCNLGQPASSGTNQIQIKANNATYAHSYWGNDTNHPPTGLTAFTAMREFTSSEYTAVGAKDNNWVNAVVWSPGYSTIKHNFTLPANNGINWLYIYDYAKTELAPPEGQTTYVWNYTSNSWKKVSESSPGTTGGVVATNLTSGFSDYIRNNVINILFQDNDTGWNIFEDYVYINVSMNSSQNPFCGDSSCNNGETQDTCCQDCGCPSGQSCNTTSQQCYTSTNLVGFWKFDESSGTVASDSSGNGNSGTLYSGASICSNPPTSGCPTWTTGESGNALRFDGTNDYVRVNDSNSLRISGDLTISAWINWKGSTSGYGRIIEKGFNDDDNYGIEIEESTSKLFFEFEDSNNQYHGIYESTGSVVKNAWQYIAVVYDDTNNRIYFYNNGTQTYSRAVAFSLKGTQRDDLLIGRQNLTSWDNWFNGIIDEVKIWNRSLTASEIQAEYSDS